MKFALILCLVVTTALAAQSGRLFPTGGSTFAGAAGNVQFDGRGFVVPTVSSNGAIGLSWVSTNGTTISNLWLGISGSTPRLIRAAPTSILTWIEDSEPNVLIGAVVADGVAGPRHLLATNVELESVSLSAAGAEALVVWQDGEPVSRVWARTIGLDAQPTGSTFVVASGAKAQRYPSVANDGARHLVCWMEQNTGGSECHGQDYWRVMGQWVAGGSPTGLPIQVSQTNSMDAHRTDCSFGTNFLIVWSANHRWSYPEYPCDTAEIYAAIHGRMVVSEPTGSEFVITADPYWNTNAAVAYGGGRFLVTGPNSDIRQAVQPLRIDGAQTEFAIPAGRRPAEFARVGFGDGRFCVIYTGASTNSYAVVFGPAPAPDQRLTNLRRTGSGGIAVDCSYPALEVTTNLVNWWGININSLPGLTNLPLLVVRSANYTWHCVENLRAISWAKQRWAFEKLRDPWDTPTACDLFCAPGYLPENPACPENGTYTLGTVSTLPTCSVAGHRLQTWPGL